LLAADVQTALLDRHAVPLLLVSEVMRNDAPVIKNTDDLGLVLDTFSEFDVSHLPVAVAANPRHVIGLVSRSGLMRKYQEASTQST
jgi:CBS domain-containing protein